MMWGICVQARPSEFHSSCIYIIYIIYFFFTVTQIIEKDGEPFFEVEMNEKPIIFSPKDVLKIIFNKLLGNFDFFGNKPHFT